MECTISGKKTAFTRTDKFLHQGNTLIVFKNGKFSHAEKIDEHSNVVVKCFRTSILEFVELEEKITEIEEQFFNKLPQFLCVDCIHLADVRVCELCMPTLKEKLAIGEKPVYWEKESEE